MSLLSGSAEEADEHTGKGLYLETYGCQMNMADSELILGSLAAHGYTPVESPEQAEVVLLNTCAIREHAEQRVAQRVRQLIAQRRDGLRVKIGLAGCMAQNHRDRLLESIPGLDFVVGPDGYRRLGELLAADEPVVDVKLDRRETYEDIAPRRGEGVRAWLTIMRGCDRRCTFCIVPSVRGRERSLPASVLLADLQRIAEQGYKEVILLGQTVNAYSHEGVDFGELLRRAASVEGIERIRYTSPHPADMNDSAIAALSETPKVSPYLHLPLQSGSDAVLTAMGRGHSVDEYRTLVCTLREAVPDLALSTDIIVGYPGESEADFEATSAFMEEMAYDHAFLFKYSRRDGTHAAKLAETVGEEEKGARLQRLIAEQEERSGRVNQATVGTVTEVLVESPAKRQKDWLAGKNPQFKTVVFEPAGARIGDIVSVRVEAAGPHTLRGKQVDSPKS